MRTLLRGKLSGGAGQGATMRTQGKALGQGEWSREGHGGGAGVLVVGLGLGEGQGRRGLGAKGLLTE